MNYTLSYTFPHTMTGNQIPGNLKLQAYAQPAKLNFLTLLLLFIKLQELIDITVLLDILAHQYLVVSMSQSFLKWKLDPYYLIY